MSDLSHSIEDSEPAASICSSSSTDDAAESSSLAEDALELATGSASKVEAVPQLNQQPAYRSFVMQKPKETESALELKMEEVENARHSAIGLYLEMFEWIFFTENTYVFVCTCWSAVNKKNKKTYLRHVLILI